MNGSVSLLDSSELKFEIGGLLQGIQHDYVDVNGSVIADGSINLTFLNGFESLLTDLFTFTLLTADAPISGEFNSLASGNRIATSDGLGSFQVDYGPSSPFGSNKIVLSQGQAVPEPSAAIFILGGGALLFRRQPRCRR